MQTIYTILKNEHRGVKRMIKDSMRKKSSGKLPKIFDELNSHMEGEEQYFYPVLKEKEMNGVVIEAFEQHKIIRTIMGDLGKLDGDDEDFLPKTKVLFDMISNHARKEEKEIFPKAKKLIEKDYEKEIADNYLNFKEAFFQ